MRLIPLVFVVACGGPSAEAPLTIPLGLDHVATEKALHEHQFCRKAGEMDTNRELFPRCDRPAAELGDAWVQAIFDGDKLVELRRWERYADDNKAIERWNELIAARAKTSTPADDALHALEAKNGIQGGTRSVKAFRDANGTLIAVYLLTRTPPEDANVLEKIGYANKQ
jgi:hypothetical protein